MIEALECVFARISLMDIDEQQRIAVLLEDFIRDEMTAPQLTDAEARLVDAAIASIDAGRGVSGVDLEAFWNRHLT